MDGRTESQKLCPSDFLRKGGGTKTDLRSISRVTMAKKEAYFIE